MYPEDPVLIGVLNRKRDFVIARDEHWYRIPQEQMPRGIFATYIGLFLSRAFGERNGGIWFYAERKGIELAYRRDLLPQEADHKNSDRKYYRVGLGDLIDKAPPILNPTKRTITFVYTTWDRFVSARQIGDLYSQADIFVDRIYYALWNGGLRPERTWDAHRNVLNCAPQVQIVCEQGVVIASTDRADGGIYLDAAQGEDRLLAAIRAEIARKGGPATIHIPMEGN